MKLVVLALIIHLLQNIWITSHNCVSYKAIYLRIGSESKMKNTLLEGQNIFFHLEDSLA